MDFENKRPQDVIYEFLRETNAIYNLCKKYSILIEEIVPNHKAPVHAANELKSLVFHLYNAAESKNIEDNILEAKEHLCRAFYDLHSLLVSIYVEQIIIKLDAFKSTTIEKHFPDYSKTIRPVIKEFQEKLREYRSQRNTDTIIINANISEFESQISTLALFDDMVEEKKAEMEKSEETDFRKKFATGILIFVLVLLAVAVGYYLAKK